jgi:hypothetical protein
MIDNNTKRVVKAKGQRLSPKELGALAEQLANAIDPVEQAQLKGRLTRGFYGERDSRHRQASVAFRQQGRFSA